MQKHITKFLILTIILTAALSVNYLFAAWVGPTQSPPGGNTSTPIHVGSTDQVKDGGLSVDALSVFGGGYFQGNVGVGVVTPTEALDISGGVKVGNTTNTNAGTIRWTGADLEVYNGSAWVSLTSEEAAPAVPAVPAAAPKYTDCINVGGSYVGGMCYVGGSSCPSGWSPNASYSSTVPNSGSTNKSSCGRGNKSTPPQCTTGSHNRANAGVESCVYGYSYGYRNWGCSKTRESATQTEIGCVKN